MNKRTFALIPFLSFFLFFSLGAQPIVVTNGDLPAGQDFQWTAGNVYLLDGLVIVKPGSTLTIEPGTVIRGREDPTTGDAVSTLVIARGARIEAVGTSDDPIIFTTESDNLDGGNGDGSLCLAGGFWGGIYVLGNAQVATENGTSVIPGLDGTQPLLAYGGSNDGDDSGILNYVSVRHAGRELSGGSLGAGIIMAGVGNSTQVEFIEAFASSGAGILFLGGTVDVKHAAAGFCRQTGFFWNEGYRGEGQFWFTIMPQLDEPGSITNIFWGGTLQDGQPILTSNPTVHNATFIGAGFNSGFPNTIGLLYSIASGGSIVNSLILEHPSCGIVMEDNSNPNVLDSRSRLENGDFVIQNNIWSDIGEIENEFNTFFNIVCDPQDQGVDYLVNHLDQNGNTIEDPQLADIDWQPAGDRDLDPRPQFNGPAYVNLAGIPDNSFFEPVSYKGAFGGTNWLKGWTGMDQCDYLAPDCDLTVALAIGDVACTGDDDGTVTVDPGGGTPPYQYLWSNEATTASITGLSGGSYSVTITDNLGCQVTAVANVGEPSESVQLAFLAVVPDYPSDGNDGSVTISVGGGNPGYNISLTGPVADSDTLDQPGTVTFSGLSVGIYSLTVTDQNGCSETKSFTISDGCEEFLVTAAETDVACAGEATGAIDLTVSAATGPVTYDWNADALDGAPDHSDLAAGTYTVTVTDSVGCSANLSINISQPEQAISLSCEVVDAPVFVENALFLQQFTLNNDLEVNFTGGEPPYILVLSGPVADTRTVSFPQTETFFNLPAGDYTLTLTDGLGCPESCSFNVPEPCFVIRDDDLLPDSTYYLTRDKCYLIDGLVYLEAGGELNIEAGTVIQGMAQPTTGDPVSALIIAKGAEIYAEGTAEAPILFTAEADDPDNPSDLNAADRGLWGGLLILGRGQLAGESNIDSTSVYFPNQLKSTFGGTSDGDDSGELRYVSIRHAGAPIAAGARSAGLVLGGVGAGTQLEYIEVLASAGDGIQLLGGRAGVKRATVAFASNDAYQLDQGYRGNGQYWFGLQGTSDGANAISLAGNLPGATTTLRFTNPIIHNATFIGAGAGAGDGVGDPAIYFHRAAGGTIANSIITEFSGHSIEVEDLAGTGIDSRQRLLDRALLLKFNVWWDFAEGDSLNAGPDGIIRPTQNAEDPAAVDLVNQLLTFRNVLSDPKLRAVSRNPNGSLDPRAEDCVAFFDFAGLPKSNTFFDTVAYKGAFDSPGAIWAAGWTGLEEMGYFPSTFAVDDTTTCTIDPEGKPCIVDFPDDMSTQDIREEVEMIRQEKGEPIDSCHCIDGQPRLYLFGPSDNIELLTGRQGSGGGSSKDTTGIGANFTAVEEPMPSEPAVFCLGPTNPANTGNALYAKVAIIDSGMDLFYPRNPNPTGGHSALRNVNWINPREADLSDTTDNDENCLANDIDGVDYFNYSTSILDKDGHGTHLAGIVAEGYPRDIDLQLMNLKIFEPDVIGGDGVARDTGSVFDLICAIHYAIDKEVDVINLSLGYFLDAPNRSLYEALKRAEEREIIVVISAGNDTIDLDNPVQDPRGERWPARFRNFYAEDGFYRSLSNLIVVTGLNPEQTDIDTTYSNVGFRTVDIAARGTISSTSTTYHDPTQKPPPLYVNYAGTSMSAAVLTKLISIVRARKRDTPLSMGFIFDQIGKTAISLPVQSQGKVGSNGMLDFEGALEAMGVPYFPPPANPGDPGPDELDQAVVDSNAVAHNNLYITLGRGDILYRDVTLIVKKRVNVPDSADPLLEIYRYTCPAASRIVWNCIKKDGVPIEDNKDYFLFLEQAGKAQNPTILPPTFQKKPGSQ